MPTSEIMLEYIAKYSDIGDIRSIIVRDQGEERTIKSIIVVFQALAYNQGYADGQDDIEERIKKALDWDE